MSLDTMRPAVFFLAAVVSTVLAGTCKPLLMPKAAFWAAALQVEPC